jgi:hypothetical protein
MSTQLEGIEGAVPAREASTYTVQVFRRLPDAADALDVWQDVATIQVPLRTKRRAVVASALREAGIRPIPGEPGPKVRVLDEDSAAVIEPEPFQPESEWRIK